MNDTTLHPTNHKQSKKRSTRKMGKRAFWIWVSYQAIKGTLTTVFIWAPMIYLYFTQ